MFYQLGWTTLPGLRGLSVSEFRAIPTNAPDNERGIAIEFVSEADREAFLKAAQTEFAIRRFTNSADAFDSVKAWALERAEQSGIRKDRSIGTVNIVKQSPENLVESKDEEYAYWQSRPAIERLVATQELSFSFFEGRGNEAEIRRQFLRSAVVVPRR